MNTGAMNTGACADCGEDAQLLDCADGQPRCSACALWLGYCEGCGGEWAIIDDDLWYSGLCAACRADAWADEQTERAASRLWDTGR